MPTPAAVVRVLFCTLLLVSLVLFGSADPTVMTAVATGTFALALVSLALRTPAATLLEQSSTILLIVGIGGWVIVRGLFDRPQVPLWTGDQALALVQFSSPFAAYFVVLRAFPDIALANRYLKLIMVAVSIIALISVLQFAIAPTWAMFMEKSFYRDSLTGTFINRNTAATFFGVSLCLCLAICIRAVANEGRRTAILWALCSGIMMIATGCTQSRGGIASSFVGALVTVVTMMSLSSRRPSTEPWHSRVLKLLGVLVLLVLVGNFLADRILLDAAENVRFCVLPALLELLQDNWLTGTGMGTFRLVFPEYRPASCGIYEVWDLAHNVFLDGWITLGIVAPLATLAGAAGLLRAFALGIHNRRQRRWIPVAMFGAVTVVVLHSLVDFSVQIPGFAMYLATILGLGTTVSKAKYLDQDAGSDLSALAKAA